MWSNWKRISSGDYYYALLPQHPNAYKGGYVPEYRIVMENKLGRLLTHNELVHHLNRNKKDNNPSNLEVMEVKKHNQLHLGKIKVVLICPQCKQSFQRRECYIRAKKKQQSAYIFCSRKCVANYYVHKGNPYGNSNNLIPGANYKKEVDIILQKEENKSLTAYAIAKKYGLNANTVRNHIKLLK